MSWTVRSSTWLLLTCATLVAGRSVTTSAPPRGLRSSGLRAGRAAQPVATEDETPATDAQRDALAAALTANLPAAKKEAPATNSDASEEDPDAFASALAANMPAVEEEKEAPPSKREASATDRDAFASALAANMPSPRKEAQPAKPEVSDEGRDAFASALFGNMPAAEEKAPPAKREAPSSGRDAFASALAANMPAAGHVPSTPKRSEPAEKELQAKYLSTPVVSRASPATKFAAPAVKGAASAASRASLAEKKASSAKREASAEGRDAFASALFGNMPAAEEQAPPAKREVPAAGRDAFASALAANMPSAAANMPSARKEAPPAKREASDAGRDAFASALFGNMAEEKAPPAVERASPRSAQQAKRPAPPAPLANNPWPKATAHAIHDPPPASRTASTARKNIADHDADYSSLAEQLEQLMGGGGMGWGAPAAQRAAPAAQRRAQPQPSRFAKQPAGHATPSSLAELQEEAMEKLRHAEPMQQATAAASRRGLSAMQEDELEDQAVAESIMDGFDNNGDGKISLYELMEHVGDIHETHPEFKDWHSGFQEADADNDMHLTIEELSSLLNNVGRQEEQLQIDDEKTRHASMAASIMEGLDANEDGKVSLQELMSNLSDEHHQTPEFKGWHKGFQQADADKDMHLTLDELANLLMAADEEEL